AGNIAVIDLATGAAHPVVAPAAGGEQAFDPHLSPDGAQVAFVRGGELWVAPLAGGAARQLTHGATRLRTHAQAEFVAQEEMNRHTGHWWSPDGHRLVYEDADGSRVEKLFLSDPADPMAAVEAAPYPRPGKPNVDVRLGIISSSGGPTVWIDW